MATGWVTSTILKGPTGLGGPTGSTLPISNSTGDTGNYLFVGVSGTVYSNPMLRWDGNNLHLTASTTYIKGDILAGDTDQSTGAWIQASNSGSLKGLNLINSFGPTTLGNDGANSTAMLQLNANSTSSIQMYTPNGFLELLNLSTTALYSSFVVADSTGNLYKNNTFPVGPTGPAGSSFTGPTGPTGNTGPPASDALAWTTYTPTWTADSSNPTLGDGVLTGRYKTIGKAVFFNIQVTTSTTTTYGDGDWQFGLPVNAVDSNSVLAPATYINSASGIQWFNGIATNKYNQTNSNITAMYGSTIMVPLNDTHPFSWTSNCAIVINGTYESV